MKRYKYLSVIVAMVFSVLLLAGCSPSLEKGTPKLPPGFLEAPVPAGDLSAYLYLAQESSITIPLARFGHMEVAGRDLSLLGAIPIDIGIDSAAVWVGPGLDRFGAGINFEVEPWAQAADVLLTVRAEVTHWRDGRRLNLVRGTGGWAGAMEVAIRSGDDSRFQDAYPTKWELMRLLPESPPMDPVAAGFVQVDSTLLDSLASEAGLSLSGLGQALGTINVTDIAYASYTSKPLNLPEEVGRDYLEDSGVGTVFVAQSSYPGFLLGFFLNTFADRVGLETGTEVSGQDVLSREEGGMHLLVKTVGSSIFMVLASSSQDAEQLMASVLDPQTG